MLYKQPKTPYVSRQGPFTIRRIYPGMSGVPNHNDHGYGPLAAVDDATLQPGTQVGMHEHKNDEIVSYVHQGAMHHSDSAGMALTIDSQNLMVMNAGRSFWHEEQVYREEQTTHTLQIFIRPHTIDLEPELHHLVMVDSATNEWRLLVGPDGSNAPTTVRNDIQIYDGRLARETHVKFPSFADWDTYFVVLQGQITVADKMFTAVESGLIVDEQSTAIFVQEDALVVIFLINRQARLTYEGTIGH